MRVRGLVVWCALVMGLSSGACSGDDNGGGGGDTGEDARGEGGQNDTLPDQTPDTVLPDVTSDPSPDVPPAGCGSVTFFGECDGSTLLWCQNEGAPNASLVTTDCAAQYAGLATGVCALIADDYGYDCAVSVGDDCIFQDSTGPFIALCGGTEPGCVISDDDAVCQEDVGTCVEADEGTCLGDAIVLLCNVSQPTLLDCGAAGGSCDDAGDDPLCVDIPEGGACGGEFICADGLDCVGETADTLGTCTAGGGGDVDTDMGTDVSDDVSNDVVDENGDDV
jgi:hypothetical protein